ncbi:MAG: hypothetical protein JWN14_2593 [Chthonomonadales bacterium]|nr:hypothetical protein [Chthonomonadales bacterium]
MQRSIGRPFSAPQTRWYLISAFVVCSFLLATTCWSQRSLSKAQIEERLRYLTTVDHFTPTAPLSQETLMDLVLEQRYWGVFPERYCGKEKRPGFDGYITRAMIRRFLKDLIGEDLTVWKSLEGDPTIQGDELRWVYNTANTTHQRPSIRMISRKNSGQNTVNATFQIFDYPKDSNGDKPTVKVATGAASLVHKGQNWTVTTWNVKRLSR